MANVQIKSRKNYLVFDSTLVMTIILMSLVIISLFVIADGHMNVSIETLYWSRVIFAFIGPFLAFTLYILITYVLLGEEVREQYFQEGLIFTILMGVIGILFAIALETRFSIVALLFILFNVSPETIILVLFAVIPPITEEFVKGLPLILLARAIKIDSDEVERRLYTNPKVFVFYAVLSGSIFNFMETLNYLWSAGSIFSVNKNEVWFTMSRQILLRSLNPLHIVTTLTMALGIIYAFASTTNKVIEGKNIQYFGISYLGAIIVHALWNGSLVLQDENTSTLSIFGVPLPVFNVVLLFGNIIGFVSILYFVSKLQIGICSECDEWHGEQYAERIHNLTINTRQKLNVKFGQNTHQCRYCDTYYTQRRCPNCNTSKLFICENCDHPYPVYETTCWNCESSVDSVFRDIFEFRPSLLSKLGNATLLLFSGVYLPYGVALIISINSAPPNIDTEQQLISLLLYIVIGLAMIFSYLWTNKKGSSELASLIGRYLLALLIIQIGTYYLILGQILTFLQFGIYPGTIAFIFFLTLFYFGLRIFQTEIIVIGKGGLYG